MIINLQNGKLVIDICRYDTKINAQELWDGGVRAVILGINKGAWNGNKYLVHQNCLNLANQVKVSPLILMTYFYYYPQYDPIVEANWYVDAMFENGMPVAYAWGDCEAHDAVMDAEVRSERHRMFMAQVASRFPKAGVYTNKSYAIDYCNGASSTKGMNKWLQKYKAWIPHWRYGAGNDMRSWESFKATEFPSFNFDQLSSQVNNTVGHQFTGDRYHLPGVYDSGMTTNAIIYKNRCRLDVSLFTNEFMASLTNTPYVPPVVIPVPTVGVAYKVTPVRINVRSAPVTVQSTWVRYAEQGEVVYVIGNPTNGYVQLVDRSWVWMGYLIKA